MRIRRRNALKIVFGVTRLRSSRSLGMALFRRDPPTFLLRSRKIEILHNVLTRNYFTSVLDRRTIRHVNMEHFNIETK